MISFIVGSALGCSSGSESDSLSFALTVLLTSLSLRVCVSDREGRAAFFVFGYILIFCYLLDRCQSDVWRDQSYDLFEVNSVVEYYCLYN